MQKQICLCFVFIVFLFCVAVKGETNGVEQSKLSVAVQGKVFCDQNNNGILDVGEKGIPSVAVSNGQEISTTDLDGQYSITITPQDGQFVFITTPAGYKNSSLFYQKITSVPRQTVNFGVIPAAAKAAENFSFVQITDIHIEGKESVKTFKDDLAEIMALDSKPDFIIATGDLVHVANPENFTDYLAGIKDFQLKIYNAIGNHDSPVNLYETYLGPSNYSFDYGRAHFVVLNCVEPKLYAQWLKKDLDRQPKDKINIVCQHYAPDKNLLDFLSQYNTRVFLNGHWHSNKAFYYGKILVLSTPTLRFGGIDCSSRGYRVITFKDGTIQTRYRWGGMKTLPKKNEGAVIGDSYKLKWKANLDDGTGITASVLDNGYVYVGIQDDDNVENCGVVCLDSRNGKRLWKFKTDSSIKGKPVRYNGILCAVSVTGAVYGLDAVSGQLRWKFQLGEAWERWVYNSPVIKDEKIFCGVAPYFVCLNLKTGEKIWQAPLLGYDWISCRSNPVIDDSAVYVNFNWTGGLTVLNKKDGSVIWKKKEVGFETTHSTPAVQGNTIFDLADSTLYSLNKKSGKKNWQKALDGGWTVSSPAVKDSNLVVGTPDGKVLAVNAATGQEIWSFQTGPSIGSFSPYVRGGSQVMSSPVIADNKVYVGANDGAFYILDLITGKLLWQYQTNMPILSIPSVTDDGLYFCDSKGTVYAFVKK